MKMFLFTVIMLLFPSLKEAVAGDTFWKKNYQEALSQARDEGKPLLLFFSGSDWSPYSMKMKHEILETETFGNSICPHFVCVEIDFPKYHSLPPFEESQNRSLKERHNIEDFPRILLLDLNEQPIASLGPISKTPEQLTSDLLNLLNQHCRLGEILKTLDSKKLQLPELKKGYAIAQELGQHEAMRRLIQAGIASEGKAFFLVEKYRLLVTQGKLKDPETHSVREELAECDPSDKEEWRCSLALIDFQELSKKETDPEVVIQPLKEYLNRYAGADTPNRWRVEMMIAQFYLDYDQWDSALEHAQTAFNCAPPGKKSEISHSLEYMRKKVC